VPGTGAMILAVMEPVYQPGAETCLAFTAGVQNVATDLPVSLTDGGLAVLRRRVPGALAGRAARQGRVCG